MFSVEGVVTFDITEGRPSMFCKKTCTNRTDGIDLGLYHSFRLLSVVLCVQVKSLKLGHKVDQEQM